MPSWPISNLVKYQLAYIGLNNLIKKQKELEGILKLKSKEVNALVNAYNREIKKFESSVAKQIAIPFYVFECGCGASCGRGGQEEANAPWSEPCIV